MKRAVNPCLSGLVGRILAAGVLMLSGISSRAEIAVTNGQTIAFVGDAITQFGWQNPHGYVRLVVAGLDTNGVKVVPVPAGVVSNRSDLMLARLKADVLEKKPDWVVLSCGLNDIRTGTNGVPLARFTANMTDIVDQCRSAGCKVLILTATVAGEDLGNDANQRLAAYNEALRVLANQKKCLLADLNTMFEEVIRNSERAGRLLTVDGVFMNPLGDQLMAKGILQALGLDDAQTEKAEQAWFELFKDAPPPRPLRRDLSQ